VYVIGHSQGGAIAFGMLELMAVGNQITTNGGAIKGVVTLDSPLGGVPGSWHGIVNYIPRIEAKYKSDPDCAMGIPNFTSLIDLTKAFNVNNTPDYGGSDLILPSAGTTHINSNNSVALNEGDKGVSVLTIGNTVDYIYDPTVCIGWGTNNLQERFYSTQWVTTMPSSAHVYPRAFTETAPGTNPKDPCPDTNHVSENHSLVLTNPAVQFAILQFVRGKVPSLKDPNFGYNP
jgi:hypothetical protein